MGAIESIAEEFQDDETTFMCPKCKKVGGIHIYNTEAWCCLLCDYYDDGTGEDEG